MTTTLQNTIPAGPFHLDEAFDAEAFRSLLDRADYTSGGLKKLMRGVKSSDPIDVALLDRRTANERDALQVLARLFHLGRDVRAEAVARVIAPLTIADLVKIGFLETSGEIVRATVRIEIHSELLVCSDFVHFRPNASIAVDHVLGVAPSAISLAALTPRAHVESVLDLGTGGGIQALLAARKAEHVLATDVCQRALNFGTMNARLNGLTNVEFREGSFFEPVEGQRFDLVIANPPFVISPESRFVYRDGGLGGDGVSELVSRHVADHLEEGGYAVLLLNWHHSTVADWAERPQSWTKGNGCDVRWMRFDDEDPATYAAGWLRQEKKRDPSAASATLEEWVRYYEANGMARFAMGAVVMRKRSAPKNWVRCEDIPLDISLNACGDQMERIFDAEDLLNTLGNERELLDRRFKVHPAHCLEQKLASRDGGWAIESNMLHLTSGMDFCAQVDVHTMQFLGGLDGSSTVREAAAPIAESLGREFEDVVPICLEMTKRLLRTGLLMSV